jgi:ubiquinone/menaquinone biosynthesis C-methylase UbiE
MKDPYRRIAGVYDRLFDSMNKGLRLMGIRLFRPSKGMSILDVGCGTGSYLELYRRYQCRLYGLDLSPSMLEVAKERLGEAAQLDLGDATAMPYDDGQFDLVISMLSLHEMSPGACSAVLDEIGRVLKNSGRILLIDYHPGPLQSLQGWTSKIIIFLSELAAGPLHFRNYRHFMKNGGLSALATQHGLTVEKQRVLAGGTFAACLASHNPVVELAVPQVG